jgi:D-alanine-D-alanine ligase
VSNLPRTPLETDDGQFYHERVSTSDTSDSKASQSQALVLVLYGGTSSERDVSLQTGESVLAALEGAALAGDLMAQVEAIQIVADGGWSWRSGVLSEEDCVRSLPKNSIIFNALHGGRGEGGGVQRALEEAGIGYTGSGPDASALCMNKSAARDVLMSAGLRCAPGSLITALPTAPQDLSELSAKLWALSVDGRGCFVKPNEGGSSAGIHKVSEIHELIPAIRHVLSSGESALVEAAVSGVELSVGVLESGHNELIALTPVEVQPRSAGWFDVVEKYHDKMGAIEACPPESVPTQAIDELKSAALAAHRETGCHGYSRTDFIYSEEGQLTVLEVNTLPGLTPRSLLPLEATTDGMTFPELCLSILKSSHKT